MADNVVAAAVVAAAGLSALPVVADQVWWSSLVAVVVAGRMRLGSDIESNTKSSVTIPLKKS